MVLPWASWPPLGLEPSPITLQFEFKCSWPLRCGTRSSALPAPQMDPCSLAGLGAEAEVGCCRAGQPILTRSMFVFLRMEEEVRKAPRIACMCLSFRERYVLEGSISHPSFPSLYSGNKL